MDYPVAIPVWKYHKKENWFRDLVSRAIVYFTGYEYTHVGVFFLDHLYESTMWQDEKGKLKSGIRVTKGWPVGEWRPDFCMVPWRQKVGPEEVAKIGNVLEQYVTAGRPYNVFKLIALSIVWPTRWLWKKLGWVPFDYEVFGEVCSGFVDEVMKKARWDLFPDEWEGYTVPGQFTKIHGWQRVATGEVWPG